MKIYKKIKDSINWIKENPRKTALIVTGVGLVVYGGVYAYKNRNASVVCSENFGGCDAVQNTTPRRNDALSAVNNMKRELKNSTNGAAQGIRTQAPTQDRARVFTMNFPKGDAYDYPNLIKAIEENGYSINEMSSTYVEIYQNR